MTTPTLVGIAGYFDGKSFEITQAGLRIGRDPGNELHLPDNDVSRFHARVVLHNGAVWVQDAGSRNGIFVNDARVAENKQLGPGDVLALGAHRFTMEMQDPDSEHSVSVNLDAVAEPEKKWKVWPFAVALLILLALVGLIAVAGSDGGSEQDVDDEPKSVLGGALKGGKTKAEETVSLGEALATTSGRPLTEQDEWPDPPKGAKSSELVEMGHKHYNAGRLREGLEHYQMAMKLDPKCEICGIRIERLTIEIDEQINENYDAGVRAYEAMQYDQAVNLWETVLQLETDESSAIHKQTVDYLKKARKMTGRP
ncbi:MAG TPA: FHA domain-containing protein [Myxococcota bacterium]|nr:FHA domain-containing protein [Myxococcota bacterium]